MMTTRNSWILGAMVMAAFAAPLSAQSDLEDVERLTRVGRTEEARAALLEWWEDGRSDASRRELQRGLWLRGRLTVDPVQAELDFQRLALMYPSGQFTPDAILRLAQASWAMGNEARSRQYLATLDRDYPRSEARERGEAWMNDAGPLPPPGDTPTRSTMADAAVVATAPDALAIDDPTIEPPADLPEDDQASAADEVPADEAPAGAMNYYVQLGAFADQERAIALHDEVQARDIDVRVVGVEGSRFTHVRVGRFAERAAAVELLEELTSLGISAALVRDDRTERPIGD